MKRALILVAIGIVVVAFVHFGLGDALTLDNLKAQQGRFEAQYLASPVRVVLLFFALYVAVTAVSLPGAAILSMAAGALFGLVEGTLIVSFASTIGATLAFLSSRYLFRDWVRARFGQRLKAIDAGVARDGAFYLFTLRLVPVFPFFLVNLLMGLTAIRTVTFYAVSQVGMLAATIVYVNAGTQLAGIETLSDVATPGLIASFAALGLFPWLARSIAGLMRNRRLYARWTRPRSYDRNLVVIGAGAAGLVSSYIAATVKAKVTLVEAHKMGGDCLNFGCVPSKALIRTARLAQEIRDGGRYGLRDAEPRFRFRDVMRRVNEVIRAVEPHDSVERYTGLGVDVVQGYATIVDPWTVEIARNDGASQRITTRSIIIATGGAPFVPQLPGIEDSGYVTSDTLWDVFSELDEAPKRLLVLGGGPIGCELAQCFARLGSSVTLIESGPRLLKREDEDASALVERECARLGITVLPRHKALRVEQEGGEKFLVAENEGREQALPFDALLVAVGRTARLTGYG
ncbi:MAG: FAD-dependent oxidoreductase, partial [Sphingobium sp.]